MTGALGLAMIAVGAVCAAALTLGGIPSAGAWLLAACGVAVAALSHRAPRWWP